MKITIYDHATRETPNKKVIILEPENQAEEAQLQIKFPNLYNNSLKAVSIETN